MNTRFRLTYLAASSLLLFVLPRAARAGETVLPILNGGFEDGLRGWYIPSAAGMCSLSEEQAAEGRFSLKVVDDHAKQGSDARATAVPISGAGAWELRGRIFAVSGDGLGMYVRVKDRSGRILSGESHLRGLGGSDRTWREFRLPLYTSAEATALELWIHSYSHAHVTAYLDSLHFVDLGTEAMRPPWEGQYKIKPGDTARLTPADVVGPDGIVYPNWTRCGVQGGIPDVPVKARITEFGGRPDDGADDAAALDAACRAVGEQGGGAVLLEQGVYHLDRPVTVRHNGVVIRGVGADRTRLVFRYSLPPGGVAFYGLAPGARVGPKTPIEMHAVPSGLQKMTIMADDVVVRTWERSTHSGNTFSCQTSGRTVCGKLQDGEHTLHAAAEYRDGTKRTAELPIVVDATLTDEHTLPSSKAAILFTGPGRHGPKRKLRSDGQRGSLRLVVDNAEGLAEGDRIFIEAPATARWKKLTRNACRWGAYRRYAAAVTVIDGTALGINQPLRIDFPMSDDAYVQKLEVIERCGVEDLSIEQTEDLWISTVLFQHAWNCWARGVTVRKCGRFPVYGGIAKWCEIRDCVFDDAWFKGGGGTAYAGWENSWDCLMENVETFKMRHAPLFQWAASGCVVRKSVFHESDGQWHSGWTHENLFEQCTIGSTRGHGGYGFGMWASPPEDTAHGPNGPRNVVYNCDVSSVRTGLWMGGMNENWIIAYNRFRVGNGQGVFAKTASFDHIIKGNVFALESADHPMVFLASPDCIGVEVVGNRLFGGNGRIVSGAGAAAVLEANEAQPLESAPRPVPAVPSIYEWQQQHAR